MNFQPGEQWEYSNTGYMILASVVEKVSKQHFRDFLKKNIFEPFRMSNTTLYNYQEGIDPNMPNRVFGYQKALNQKDYKLNDYHIVNDVRGDGGIYSTLNDLFKWNMALVNYKVLPKEYLDEIKLRLKVSQVVGKTVQLKKRGKEFVGLSPFKTEKTPSFTVNDEKGFYHCFSSAEHGNIFDFLVCFGSNLALGRLPEALERPTL